MDKVLYRLILGLACLLLAIVLILTPVGSGMYMDMVRREKRIIEAETRIDKKIKQLEQLKGE